MNVKTKDGRELYILRKELLPVGTVLCFAGNTPPDGFLECNGASVSRLKYRALFHEIGTTYGSDSDSTFKLPDLRGEFVRGWDHGRGVDAGRALGSFQEDAFKSHNHKLNAYSTSGGSISRPKREALTDSNPIQYNTSSEGGTETRPRNIALMYIIKY